MVDWRWLYTEARRIERMAEACGMDDLAERARRMAEEIRRHL